MSDALCPKRPAAVHCRHPWMRARAIGANLVVGGGAVLSVLVAATRPMALGQETSLAEYFGFMAAEIIVIDDDFGPLAIGDLDGDGRNDLVVANNQKSRLELLYQRAAGSEEEAEAALASGGTLSTSRGVNEFEPHWRFRREDISVSHRVGAIALFDVDGDQRTDIIYGGQPGEMVLLAQVEPGVFEIAARRRVSDLNATGDTMAIANLMGDDAPELAVRAGSAINIFPLTEDEFGNPTVVELGGSPSLIRTGDFNGDGRADLLGVLPEDATPVRLWLQKSFDDGTVLGPELRFEMPAVREVEPIVRSRGAVKAAVGSSGVEVAGLAVLERASKRLIVYELESRDRNESGAREAAVVKHTFPRGAKSAITVVDVNNDARLDVVATDTENNAVLVYLQEEGMGFVRGQRYPTLTEPMAVAAGNVDDDPAAELFVMSEEESVLGRSDWGKGPDGGFDFPMPLPTSNELVTVELVRFTDDDARVAVMSKDRRSFSLRLIAMDGSTKDIDLGNQSRTPESIVAWDADLDGDRDLLLLTPGSTMIMLEAGDDGEFKVLDEDKMGQFGLVRAASYANTALLDVTGDGAPELLIADRNYVRAVRYMPKPEGGAAPGWQVVQQYNLQDPRSRLVSIAVVDDRTVAVADESQQRLVMIERGGDGSEPGSAAWNETASYRVEGVKFGPLYAGSFSGDDSVNLLNAGEDGFAVIRTDGRRLALNQVASYRSDEEDRSEHELAAGDVNGDGFLDLITLDSVEQMLSIYTLSSSGRLLLGTEWEVFQSNLFSGSGSRTAEPRAVHVADLTGDGASDILLSVHDRLLLYPQMTEPLDLGDR